jgi:hypothetical protein
LWIVKGDTRVGFGHGGSLADVEVGHEFGRLIRAFDGAGRRGSSSFVLCLG